jgi:hypothetical protein
MSELTMAAADREAFERNPHEAPNLLDDAQRLAETCDRINRCLERTSSGA